MADASPIYVEASSLLPKRLTGIGRCLARLIAELSCLRPVRLFHAGHPQELRLSPSPIGHDEDVLAWRDRVTGQRWVRPALDEARRCTAVYDFMGRPTGFFRREVTISYDLTPILVPHTHEEVTCEQFRDYVARDVRRFDGLLAISRRTKADLEWACGVPAERVRSAPLGPSLCVEGHASSAPVARRTDRLLVVSTLEPRKNAAGVLDWFVNSRALPDEMELWWAGGVGWNLDANSLLRPGGRTVNLLGPVSDARLCELYREATATVYASFYEGFGLPVLDSLRHGAPVLCSYNSSLTEFDGPGVHYVDPCDPDTFDRAWREVAARPAEVRRPDLERDCTWAGFARALLGMCE